MNQPYHMIERDRQDRIKRETIEIHKTFPVLNKLHMSPNYALVLVDRVYAGAQWGKE